mgnify:CR=1 FL=1
MLVGRIEAFNSTCEDARIQGSRRNEAGVVGSEPVGGVGLQEHQWQACAVPPYDHTDVYHRSSRCDEFRRARLEHHNRAIRAIGDNLQIAVNPIVLRPWYA